MIVIYLKKKEKKVLGTCVRVCLENSKISFTSSFSISGEIETNKIYFLRVFIIGNVCIFYFEIHTYIILKRMLKHYNIIYKY